MNIEVGLALYEGQSKIIRTYNFFIFLNKHESKTNTSLFPIISTFLDAFFPAIYKLVNSICKKIFGWSCNHLCTALRYASENLATHL